MKAYRILIVSGLFAGLLATHFIRVYSQTYELPNIVSTSEIVVSDLSIKLHLKGNVIVDLAVDSSGKVISSKAIEGHPLLQQITMYSVSRWQFSKGAETRSVKLTFAYSLISWTEIKVKVLPYNLELKTVFGTPTDVISMIPSEYEEGQTLCKVHRIPLKKDKVELIYGLMYFDDDYRKARKRLFPNSNKEAYGGCVVDNPIYAEVVYCDKCREAETQWEELQKKKMNNSTNNKKAIYTRK